MRQLLPLLAACASVDHPARTPTAAAPPCVVFDSEPVALSPRDGRSRHHPTVDVSPDGTVHVAWQVGKADAGVAIARFGPDLTPLGAERTLSDGLTRATHPQVLAGDGESWLTWQDDDSGGIWLVRFDADGAPAAAPVVLHPADAPTDGLYPDLARAPGQPPLALWYGGHEPSTSWTIASADGATVGDLPVAPDTTRGGPATLAVHPDGRVFAAWGEQRVGWTSRDSQVRVGALGGVAEVVAADAGRYERTALAFGADGAGVVAWTRYPAAGAGWSARAVFLAADGRAAGAPVVVGDGAGHMVDVAAADDVAVLAWQQPTGSGGTDVRLQPWSLRTGEPRCAPSIAHPPRAAAQARPNLWLGRGADGQLRGVVVWHAATAQPGVQIVAGRTFTLAPAAP